MGATAGQGPGSETRPEASEEIYILGDREGDLPVPPEPAFVARPGRAEARRAASGPVPESTFGQREWLRLVFPLALLSLFLLVICMGMDGIRLAGVSDTTPTALIDAQRAVSADRQEFLVHCMFLLAPLLGIATVWYFRPPVSRGS